MQKLRFRYFVSFVLLGAVLAALYFILNAQLMTQQSDSRVINVAGRQRMLSQKITKVSSEILIDSDSDLTEHLIELRFATELWKNSHEALNYGSDELSIEANYNEEIFNAYDQLNASYRQILDASIRLQLLLENELYSYEQLKEVVDQIREYEADYLFQMNEIVFMHDEEAYDRLMKSHLVLQFSVLFFLLFLLLSWLLLVRPTLRQAELVDRVKTEFVSLASHQLRTPLTSVSWFTEMLIDGDAGALSKTQKEYAQNIYLSTQRMVELVNALLNVSRIELGSFAIHSKALSIKKLLNFLLVEMQPMLKAKNQKIKLKVASGLTRYLADEKLLRMVFQNLLSNASKYTPENGELSCVVSLESSHLKIVVKDTGIGIPERQQDKIFSKLFRADNAAQSDTEGTGLGLYIVKSIVEASGGKISFVSLEGVGTEFTVLLPKSGMKAREGTKVLSHTQNND